MSLEDDVFTDKSPTIVDCDVLEAAKENVQPLGTGRRVTALSAILATPHAQRDSKLSKTRNRLRINVELALDDEEDGNPLEAYCRLVYWTIENYPQGISVESGLLELLEEATRVLKDDRGGKWRGDLKYLKLWLLYASFVERPTLIYRFLIANEIGTDHALLYEEYAAVLERDGRRKDADDAYVLGIARRAEPLDHLKARHDDFQKRMMSNTLAPPAAAVPTAPAPARTVLGSSSRSQSVSGARLTSSSSSARSVGISSTSTSTSTLTSSSRPAPSSNAPLQIFVDPTGSESQPADSHINTWTDIGTRKTRIKENVPETKKLGGTTVKHTGRGRTKRVASGSGSATAATASGAGAGAGAGAVGADASSSGSRIPVFRDPQPEDLDTHVRPPVPVAKARSGRDVPSKTGAFVPFVDGHGHGQDAAAPAPAFVVPSTPRFTPFRDDEMMTTTTPATSNVPPTSVMKPKSVAVVGKPIGSASEMEALRKDPLKNYTDVDVDRSIEGDG